MTDRAILLRWDAERGVMHPASPYQRATIEAEYQDGRVYRFAETKESTDKSRNQYFAALHEAWLNLPEWHREWPTDTHMRKKILIIKGYYRQHDLVAGSPEDALKLAAFVEQHDEYAVVVVDGCVVSVLTAKSQKRDPNKGMEAREFQRSKDDVLAYCADLLGVKLEQLLENSKNRTRRERPPKQIGDAA